MYGHWTKAGDCEQSVFPDKRLNLAYFVTHCYVPGVKINGYESFCATLAEQMTVGFINCTQSV